MWTAGSLFSGYGGLDLATEAVFGARTLWHSEIDPAASRVLEARWPDVPNLGDVTAVDWTAVPRVDVLAGGFPCQDVSHAGKRAGLRPDTRSGLWSQMAYAIDQLRPAYVVAENVRGLLSAQADSDMEPCPLCVGDEPAGALRALGAVLGDLADLGYDAWWCGLRAADVGAPHGRFRVFILGSSADATADATGDGRHEGRPEPAGQLGRPDAAQRSAAPADTSSARLGELAEGASPEEAGPDAGHQPAGHRRPRPAVDWGPYQPAVRRWEHVTGRVAPAPTETSPRGAQRLSPRFVEWMMGLPAGWVTDVPGTTRNDQLKMLGNGVVPQQATAALTHLLKQAS